jgi:hypothetical protein
MLRDFLAPIYPLSMFAAGLILETAALALENAQARLALEQAVYGLDALDEVALHPILSAGFAESPQGFGVLREVAYPAQWKTKVSADLTPDPRLPLPRDRERCDLVLLERPGLTLADPLSLTKSAIASQRAARGTLFESLQAESDPEIAAAPDTVGPGDVFWLELKAVSQFALTSGILGPNAAYGAQLVGGVTRDAAKLARDAMIEHAGVLLVLFAADEATADHDVAEMLHRCLDRSLPIGAPESRVFPITDRMGNTVCCTTLIPVRRS